MLDERIRNYVEASAPALQIEDVLARPPISRPWLSVWVVGPMAVVAGLIGLFVVFGAFAGSREPNLESAAVPPASVPGGVWVDLSAQFAPDTDGRSVGVVGIARMGERLIAYGHEYDRDALWRQPTVAIWQSGDGGQSWVRVGKDVPAEWNQRFLFDLVVFNDEVLLFVSESDRAGTAVYSTSDLITWESIELPEGIAKGYNVSTAEVDGRLIVWSGQELDPGQLWETSDGRRWSRADTVGLPTTLPVGMLASNGETLVLVSNIDGALRMGIWFSDDGYTWGQALLSPASFANVRLISVVHGPDGFAVLGVGADSFDSFSSDGEVVEKLLLEWVGLWQSTGGAEWALRHEMSEPSEAVVALQAHPGGFAFIRTDDEGASELVVARDEMTRSQLPVGSPGLVEDLDGRWFVAGTDTTGRVQVHMSG